MTFEKKLTNKQNREPSPRVHHHEQGLTCDCRQCRTEFTQFHNEHVYCSPACNWKHKGIHTEDRTCNYCKCTDHVPNPQNKVGYVCETCQKFRLNSTRTDVKRRVPQRS